MNDQVKIIAHRGASAEAPENTMAAFRRALDSGADMIELDVHLSKDDSIIVMHDQSVNRTTNGKGQIGELTYDEIRKLDTGEWFGPEFKGEKVPTLADVFECAIGKKILLIELKWSRKGIYAGLADKVIDVINKYDATGWVIIQSFETKYLEEIQMKAPEITLHQLLFGYSDLLPVYYDTKLHLKKFRPLPFVKSVNCYFRFAGSSKINEWHEMKKEVFVYTIDKPSQIIKAASFGTDGIITNNPRLALEVLKRK